MARNSFSTGANMRGFVDIYANNVSLVETNQINNIKNIFVDNSRIKTSNEENNVYNYNETDISDFYVSGLSSMINYCKSNFKPKNAHTGQSITYEENNYYSKKYSNSFKNKFYKIILQGDDTMPLNINKSYSRSQIDTIISKLNISTLSNFITINDISNNYFNKVDISNNYFNKIDISTNYYTIK